MDPMKFHEHYCSEDCKKKGKPCDLCTAQRRKKQKESEPNVPTLRHNPFEKLKR